MARAVPGPGKLRPFGAMALRPAGARLKAGAGRKTGSAGAEEADHQGALL